MASKVHSSVGGFLELVSLINQLNRPISALLLEKLSYLGVIPNVKFESPVINDNPNL